MWDGSERRECVWNILRKTVVGVFDLRRDTHTHTRSGSQIEEDCAAVLPSALHGWHIRASVCWCVEHAPHLLFVENAYCSAWRVSHPPCSANMKQQNITQQFQKTDAWTLSFRLFRGKQEVSSVWGVCRSESILYSSDGSLSEVVTSERRHTAAPPTTRRAPLDLPCG